MFIDVLARKSLIVTDNWVLLLVQISSGVTCTNPLCSTWNKNVKFDSKAITATAIKQSDASTFFRWTSMFKMLFLKVLKLSLVGKFTQRGATFTSQLCYVMSQQR